MNQYKKVEFRAAGEIKTRGCVRRGERWEDAARRLDIDVGDDNGTGDGSVRLATWCGWNGVAYAK